jgi:hypothetical protein
MLLLRWSCSPLSLTLASLLLFLSILNCAHILFTCNIVSLNISGLNHRRTSEQLVVLQEGLVSPLSIWLAGFCTFPSPAVYVVVDDAWR